MSTEKEIEDFIKEIDILIEKVINMKEYTATAILSVKKSLILRICYFLRKYKKLQEENEELKAKLEFKKYGDLDDIEFEEHIEKIKHESLEDEKEKWRKKIRDRVEELKILEDDIKDKRIVYIDEPEFEENYIPKQKIKDKIEELKKEHKKIEQISDFIIADTIQPKIEILEELLEEND